MVCFTYSTTGCSLMLPQPMVWQTYSGTKGPLNDWQNVTNRRRSTGQIYFVLFLLEELPRWPSFIKSCSSGIITQISEYNLHKRLNNSLTQPSTIQTNYQKPFLYFCQSTTNIPSFINLQNRRSPDTVKIHFKYVLQFYISIMYETRCGSYRLYSKTIWMPNVPFFFKHKQLKLPNIYHKKVN